MSKNKGRNVETKEKKKMTRYEKRKILGNIFTWLVVIIMVFGSLLTLIYPLFFS